MITSPIPGKNHKCSDCGTVYEETDEIGRLKKCIELMKGKVKNEV